MSIRAAFWLVVVVVVASIASAASEARACSCGQDMPPVVPEDGATDVLLDTKVWVFDNQRRLEREPMFVVADSDDSIVAGEWSRIDDEWSVAVFHPDDELLPNTTYRLTFALDTEPPFSTFTTGERTVLAPPRVPSPELRLLAVGPGGGTTACFANEGSFVFARVEAEHDGMFLVADVDQTSSFDVLALSGTVTTIASGTSVVFGSSTCAGRWPGAAPGVVGRVRFGALDAAGNFSGWSDELVIDVPYKDYSEEPALEGCASTPATNIAAVLLVMMLVRARRRRR